MFAYLAVLALDVTLKESIRSALSAAPVTLTSFTSLLFDLSTNRTSLYPSAPSTTSINAKHTFHTSQVMANRFVRTPSWIVTPDSQGQRRSTTTKWGVSAGWQPGTPQRGLVAQLQERGGRGERCNMTLGCRRHLGSGWRWQSTTQNGAEC